MSSLGASEAPPLNQNEEGTVQPISDEEFAELMSGQEELLEVGEKNALG